MNSGPLSATAEVAGAPEPLGSKSPGSEAASSLEQSRRHTLENFSAALQSTG